MSRSLRLHPAAQRELDEAAAYYDAESPGLGAAFLDEAEHAFRQILAFPEAASLASAPVRVKVLVAFPYSVHYSVIGDVVLVLGLAHHSRRPFYWPDNAARCGSSLTRLGETPKEQGWLLSRGDT